MNNKFILEKQTKSMGQQDSRFINTSAKQSLDVDASQGQASAPIMKAAPSA